VEARLDSNTSIQAIALLINAPAHFVAWASKRGTEKRKLKEKGLFLFQMPVLDNDETPLY
jgi:hypothetical protein